MSDNSSPSFIWPGRTNIRAVRITEVEAVWRLRNLRSIIDVLLTRNLLGFIPDDELQNQNPDLRQQGVLGGGGDAGLHALRMEQPHYPVFVPLRPTFLRSLPRPVPPRPRRPPPSAPAPAPPPPPPQQTLAPVPRRPNYQGILVNPGGGNADEYLPLLPPHPEQYFELIWCRAEQVHRWLSFATCRVLGCGRIFQVLLTQWGKAKFERWMARIVQEHRRRH